ncbi:hypothetical protein PC9H_007614 [Pleurotus ostreatus]|uniref:TECPR1-like DysF domain-containing protein n=1 Tax=Pleurotus ostreatus TaxID=5322 RepID=A0A8H6ZTW8_PLEOS|nr:uncharacterized protein PC9H_007614 [Pleurotus ostreatus]KAF7428391.1 hypothetical protein PC9H_007614 [Pleurotus ostreatus]KAJ8696516.1 hypothetical protein PTI98_006383 [Pleurotus ostreatus]
MSVSLLNFVQTVPQPLTSALIQLSPQIHFGRTALEIVSWNNTLDSCLVLAGWWFVCTFYYSVCVFLLPLFLVVYAVLRVQRRSTDAASVGHPTTEDSLQAVITDLSVIQSLIPTLSLPSNSNSDASSRAEIGIEATRILRPLFTLYTLYVVATLIVPVNILAAIFGSLFITHRSRWSCTLRSTLWKSAYIRFAAYRLGAFITGTSIPSSSSLVSVTTMTNPKAPGAQPSASLRYLFTIQENQRWWMGLDWTAALLPSERPSWSTTSLLPIAPPASFSLPEDTISVIELPDNGGKGKGMKGKKRVLKRTAKWRWDEAEWKILVRREDKDDKVERVDCPLPIVKEEMEQQSQIATSSSLNSIASASNASGSTTTSRFASKLLESITSSPSTGANTSSSAPSIVSLSEMETSTSSPTKSQNPSSSLSAPSTHPSQSGQSNAPEPSSSASSPSIPPTSSPQIPHTDPSGWIYTDNKWESPPSSTHKGGLGKFTRCRIWGRVAVCEEWVEEEYVNEEDVTKKTETVVKSNTEQPKKQQPSSLVEEASIVASGTFTSSTSPPLPTPTSSTVSPSSSRFMSSPIITEIGNAKTSAREDPHAGGSLQQRLKALASRDRER